jgi:hypothetical protein
MADPKIDGVSFRHDRKFDIQLAQALINERRLAEIFAVGKIEKIELKSETRQWEETGNICIEYASDGHPSGISTTEADYWVHELRRDGATLVYLMFPLERLKELARVAYLAGRHRKGGDGDRMEMVLLSLASILQ